MSYYEGVAQLPPLAQLQVAVKTADVRLLHGVLRAHPELLNCQDEQGATPLHLAAKWQVPAAVAALVELGADTTIRDHLGYTPSDVAHWFGECANSVYTDTCQQIVACLEAATQPNA